MLAKVLASGAESSLAIQDTTTYEVPWTVPEGTHGALRLRDILPTGLAFVSGTAPTITTSASFDADVTTANAVAGVFSNDDRRFEIDLGNTTNANRDSSTVETVTAVYDVVVLNVSANTRSAQPRNTASAISTGRTKSTSRRLVTVNEPSSTLRLQPRSAGRFTSEPGAHRRQKSRMSVAPRTAELVRFNLCVDENIFIVTRTRS